MNNEHAFVPCRGCEQPLDHFRCRAVRRVAHALDIRGRVRSLSPFVAITILLLGAHPAVAQETRAATIRQEQADKQSVVAPPSPNRGEVIIDRLEDWGFFTGEIRSFYPWPGSVFPGGGVAAGAGVRKPFGDDGAVNVFGGYSIDRFWRADAKVELPTFAQNRARVTSSGRYTDAPDVTYCGIGTDTLKDADVASAPSGYVVAWRRFDNATGATTDLGVTKAAVPSVTAPGDLPSAAGAHIWVGISAAGGPESWAAPAHACFRREPDGWKLVGFQRKPGGNPPEIKGPKPRT